MIQYTHSYLLTAGKREGIIFFNFEKSLVVRAVEQTQALYHRNLNAIKFLRVCTQYTVHTTMMKFVTA